MICFLLISSYFNYQYVFLAEKKTPIISIQNQIVEGQMFQAHCRVNYACPDSPPKLRWNINPLLENSSYENLSEQAPGQWLYTETLHGIATYKMDKSSMSCSADFGTFITKSQHLSLNITCMLNYRCTFIHFVCERGCVSTGLLYCTNFTISHLHR